MTIHDAKLSFSNSGTPRAKTTVLMLHHAACNGSVEDIHRFHRYTNGWAGIGYHYYIRKDGTIWNGRPDNLIGAHCPAVNSCSVAICFEGNFENEQMSQAQKDAGAELVTYLRKKYPTITTVCRHKDKASTACPGRNFPFAYIAAGKSEPAKPSVPKDLYRVRKNWSDPKSQLGAYSSFDNAKAACKEGYSVYDESGKSVYTMKAQLYRVRKSWTDSKSQLGAYKKLDNAKKACKSGYAVYDVDGNEVYRV